MVQENVVTCPECSGEMDPAIKCTNNLAAVFAMAGMRGKKVKDHKEGFLCPSCGKFIEKNYYVHRRYEVRRSVLGSITKEMRTDDLEGAAALFFTLKAAQDADINSHPATEYFDDAENFCVWDNKTMNVVFHEGRYLTTYLLKEDSNEI